MNNVKTDRIIRLGSLIALVFSLGSIAVIIFVYRQLPPVIPLFNQMPWGEERLATRIQIVLPAGIAFLSLLINLVFSAMLYEKVPLVSRILCTTSLLLCFLAFLLTAETIQIAL